MCKGALNATLSLAVFALCCQPGYLPYQLSTDRCLFSASKLKNASIQSSRLSLNFKQAVTASYEICSVKCVCNEDVSPTKIRSRIWPDIIFVVPVHCLETISMFILGNHCRIHCQETLRFALLNKCLNHRA